MIDTLQPDEQLSLTLEAEDSLYIRLNESKVRHVFTVEQGNLILSFMKNGRSIIQSVPFSHDNFLNKKNAFDGLTKCRDVLEILPVDPYCPHLGNDPFDNSYEDYQANLPSEDFWFDTVLPLLKGPFSDCAGLITSGRVIRSVYNSAGCNHWYSRDSFTLDLSFYTPQQKAVKLIHNDQRWSEKQIEEKLGFIEQQLRQLDKPSLEIKPGKYRTYFAPQAVGEFIQMFSLSGADYYQGSSAFKKLFGGQLLSNKVTLAENFSLGLTPQFNALGEIAPKCLNLIEKGSLKSWMTSTRTAKEYHIENHYAEAHERMRSPHLLTGKVALSEILSTIGTGLYISNLHYLNWSDLHTGRLTGMTRYACFWVENGQLKAPIQDLRFDDSLYHFLGEGLVDLTQESETIINTCTYEQRSVGGLCVPGLLVNDFNYTL